MKGTTVVFEHFEFSCLGHLGEFLEANRMEYRSYVYSQVDETIHDALSDASRIILLGSPDSVNNHDNPWLHEMERAIKGQIEAGTPMLGICFGAQLLASASGQRVTALEEPRVGFRQIGNDSGSAYAGNWLCFHEEHVRSPGSIHALLNDHDTVYAFRNRNAIGLQFHPEMDVPTIERILSELPEDHPHGGKLRRSIVEFDASSKQRSFRLFDEIFRALDQS